MKKLALFLALWLGASAPALAVVQQSLMGDANYTGLITDSNISTTTAFTAGRTLTLPASAGTCIGQVQNCGNALTISDTAGAITQPFPLTIAPASGETINGNAANLIISAAGASVTLVPTSGTNWQATIRGDLVTSGICPGSASTATVTITIAAPGVITYTAHGITGACPIVFTTSSALPTGITASTVYYTVPSSITTNTFQIATTVANALAGTAITTSGTQAGTQTGTAGLAQATTTAATVTGLSLSQGDWECRATVARTLAASTSVTVLRAAINAAATTIGTQGGNDVSLWQTAANVMGVLGEDQRVGPTRIRLTATTNQFLVAQDVFTVSTNTAFGNMTCRRAS